MNNSGSIVNGYKYKDGIWAYVLSQSELAIINYCPKP